MKKLILFFVLASLALTACLLPQKPAAPVVTVSILPLKYLVGRIAGERFDIQVLTPPGANHETYEPTPKQVKMLDDSKILFMNGYLMFEDNLTRKFARSSGVELVDLSAGVDLIAGETEIHGDHVHMHGVDPHFWLSPKEVRVMAANILNALSKTDPDGREYFENNYHRLINDIDSLDIDIKNTLMQTRLRSFIIYHPALSYFARDYNLDQISIETEGKEPSARHIKTVTDQARALGITTVFIQQQFSTTTAEAVAKEIGGRVVSIDPVPENWLQSMYDMAKQLNEAMR